MRDSEISPEDPSTTTDAPLPGDQSDSGGVDAQPPVASEEPNGARREVERIRHTRISGAWATVFVGVILGIALIDFIVENTRSVRIDFFSANGRMPVAVALLAATLAGAAVVLTIGVLRTAQLRLSLRRHRRLPSAGPTAQAPAATTGEAQR